MTGCGPVAGAPDTGNGWAGSGCWRVSGAVGRGATGWVGVVVGVAVGMAVVSLAGRCVLLGGAGGCGRLTGLGVGRPVPASGAVAR